MGGMGEKGEIMYQYVPINEVEPYRKNAPARLISFLALYSLNDLLFFMLDISQNIYSYK